jgi:gamma-glutamylcyclotransferase (GGCT)/AIG2-like uncharacterized protein YtfP
MPSDALPPAAHRAARLITERGDLFVYGTLQFPDVLRVLLGRIPHGSMVALAGWRAAALAERSYPGLVPAPATVRGQLLTGLTAGEAEILDEYESGPYDLRKLTLTDGRAAWAYVWTDASAVLAHDWSPAGFAADQLPDFVARCRGWLSSRAAASAGGPPAARLHDPDVPR